VAVERELARIEAQEEIQAKVQEELGERQREMLLREQMKQIQKELGDEDERNDVEELKDPGRAALELTEDSAHRRWNGSSSAWSAQAPSPPSTRSSGPSWSGSRSFRGTTGPTTSWT
jgi:hypothetical protein